MKISLYYFCYFNIDIPHKVIKVKKNITFSDKAKNNLKEFLCKEEYLATQKRIYQKNAEDRTKHPEKDAKIICVVDDDIKVSENRT